MGYGWGSGALPGTASVRTLLIMKVLQVVAVVVLLLSSSQVSADPRGPWEVHFSPNGGCSQHVSEIIGHAKASVRLAAYAFTSEQVADALVAAKKHGLDVQVLIDRAWAHRPMVEKLRKSGVVVWTDSKHAIMHDKFVVIDFSSSDAFVETGSFNYTGAADRSNAENCLALYDPKLAKVFAANWLGHTAHSQQ